MTDFVPPAKGGFISDARETRSVLGDVPPALTDRFVLVKTIQTAERPSQAVVLRVRRAGAGPDEAPLVLKWYHWQHSPDREVVRFLGEGRRLLDEEQRRHLEELVEEGETEGHPYQVFRSHGEVDLAAHTEQNPGALPPARIEEIAGQLHRAVSALHDHEIVHRDITPDNLMVQSSRGSSLDLVLVDFGVAVHVADAEDEPAGEAGRDWRGKPRYLAPEAVTLHQTVSEEGDWWSIGMILAELSLGEHPLGFYSDSAVLYEIATHEPDVSGITDTRTRRLCEGLLTRAPESRWGAEQVDAWLRHESPKVERDRPAAFVREPDTGLTPFDFLGESFTEPEHLARALDLHHAATADLLDDEGSRGRLAAWLAQFETTGGRSPEELRRLAALRDELSGRPGPGTTVRLITWLGPSREAARWGIPLSVQGVRALSRAARAGDGEALDLVRHLASAPEILTTLARLPRGQGLDDTAARWTALRDRWPHLARELRRNPDLSGRDRVRRALRQTTAVDARLLELAREPERAAARLEAEIAQVRGRLAAPVPWFDRLGTAGQDDPPLLVAAALLAEHALREAEGRHRQQIEDEIQRLMDEDTDGVVAFMRKEDRIPTLSWALLGATLVVAPWALVIQLADVANRASQDAVLIAWLEALPAAAAVYATELLTAAYIGPPAYHPHRSLAGLIIRTSERPARRTLSRGLRTLIPVAAVLGCLVWFVGCYAVAAAPWVWPLAAVLAVAVWSVRRCHVWRRERRRRQARWTDVRRGLTAARRAG
ncbi:protein kinase [Streptomyces sp. NPDC007264]|uniref:protein kinase domain-containing protein n=1 Tax=Streptomyces sp. NPDC007264 TaxID=3364777 RepID=UPI0036D92D4D